MSNLDQSFWLRELAKTGLPASGQKAWLTSLTKAVGDREHLFPSDPNQYVRRVRQLLTAAFLPQHGPFLVAGPVERGREVLSRSQCWAAVHLEISLLDSTLRPIEGVHEAITELIALLTSSEFPLSIPPRWLVELFSDLAHMASLRMEKNGWQLRPKEPLDLASQAYLDAVLCNLENDTRRHRRQLVDFTCGDTEELVDASRQSLLPPGEDARVPPLPQGFPLDHRPRFWLPAIRVDTPKRDREGDDSSSDGGGTHRDPKRIASEPGDPPLASDPPPPEYDAPNPTPSSLSVPVIYEAPRTQVSVVSGSNEASQTAPPIDTQARMSSAIDTPQAMPIASPYGTAPIYPRVHYSLSSIMQNPLRHYPNAVSLYKNILPDPTILDLPVFSEPFGVGMTATNFKRGENDPAVRALTAINASRVSADTLRFLTWNESIQQPSVFFPFSDKDDFFHVYQLPKRRVAPGKYLHNWSFGIRLGEKASGAWANQVTDKNQPLPPPVLRKIDWRELLDILKAPGQLGLPASTNTDGALGWAVYSYMSPEVLLTLGEGPKFILLRIEGYCTRGHSSNDLMQKAKVGLCPCCARATHVLVPPSYAVGTPDRKKKNSVYLWQRFGPFASRNYAAAMYANANGSLTPHWDWVASKHVLELPYPLNVEDADALPEETPDSKLGSRVSLSGDSTVQKKSSKPPPPVHKGGASVSPSPAKSGGSAKGTSSFAGSSWEGDWGPTSSQARGGRSRGWYHY